MKVLNFATVNHKNMVSKPLLSLTPLFAIIVGIFASCGTANAAVLGKLKISGTLDVESLGEFFDTNNPLIPTGLDASAPEARKVPLTSLDFYDLGGMPNNGFGEFFIMEGTDEFEAVNSVPVKGGTIKDLPPFPTLFFNDSVSNNDSISDFLDLAFDANSGSEVEFNVDFDLTEVTLINYVDAGDGVVNGIGVNGIWKIKDDNDVILNTYSGTGTISAEITYDAIPDVNNFGEYLAFISEKGNRIEGIAYSGDFILEENPNPSNPATITEPSSLISLIGCGLASMSFWASRKRPKNIN